MQQERLTQLENKIHDSRSRFYVIGKALKEIRDEKLYRILLFTKFDKYTRSRWEIGKSQAYRLIEASNVIDNLSPIGDILPENESQVRPLVSLDPAEQRKIWRDFLKTDMMLNSLNIRKFISNIKFGKHDSRKDLTDKISVHYKAAANRLLEQIGIEKSSGWQSTSQEAALFWNKVMKEKILTDTP